jgi:O-antigen ligase
MGFKGLFFIGFFGACTLCALAEPFAGVMAYVVHYHTYPENAWWGKGLAASGIRYSFTISLFLTVGTLLNLKRLPYGRLITSQEAVYLAFIGWIIVSRTLTGKQTSEDVVDKMIKASVFMLAMTHIVVTPRRYNQLMWLLVICAIYLGYEAYTAPASCYYEGRLNSGIGGPDFSDSNALGAHAVVLLAFIGGQFLNSRHSKGKLCCFVAGGLTANLVIATRSRAAFLASIVGLVTALILAPKNQRKRIWLLVVLGALGSLTLIDSGFIERMGTLKTEEREKDASAQDRLMSWKAGLKMFQDHPLGVGPGNFAAHMGDYLAGRDGRDTHNTYVRCLAEIGLPGFALFTGLVANAFWMVRRTKQSIAAWPELETIAVHGFALQMALIMYLICMIFGSYNYIEILWVVLLLPAALQRIAVNALADRSDPASLRWS